MERQQVPKIMTIPATNRSEPLEKYRCRDCAFIRQSFHFCNWRMKKLGIECWKARQ